MEELNRKAVEKIADIKAYEQEPCEDCISREDALMCLTGQYIADKEYPLEEIISKHIRRIKALPPVQPARQKGQWILSENGWNTVCDFCRKGKWKGYIPTPEEAAEWMPICPQCGADMRKE